MSVLESPPTGQRRAFQFADKERFLRLLKERDARAGFPEGPEVTIEELHAMIRQGMIDRGIDPDSVPLASQEIVAMREEKLR